MNQCMNIINFGVANGDSAFGGTIIGVALTLRQYRGGVEVTPPFDQDLNYDFNFQDIRTIGPRKILPVRKIIHSYTGCSCDVLLCIL